MMFLSLCHNNYIANNFIAEIWMLHHEKVYWEEVLEKYLLKQDLITNISSWHNKLIVNWQTKTIFV